MAMEHILNVMASSMSAESIRMNISASNMANVESVGGSEEQTYRAKHPVFSEVKGQIQGMTNNDQPVGGVRVTDVIESDKPLNWKLDPSNPLADKDGKIYLPDVNPIQEMADMIASSRQYQASVDVMNTTKNLLMQTIKAINL
jgi:flagellar basal-body rod protein FlgC